MFKITLKTYSYNKFKLLNTFHLSASSLVVLIEAFEPLKLINKSKTIKKNKIYSEFSPQLQKIYKGIKDI